uniref:Reverse transcriptase domain-containing protein n=1 Tax=Myripristis murdjan TaxID=586833 RepID=A0A667X979_9TELE
MSNSSCCEHYLKSLTLPKLSQEGRNILDQPVTKGEILRALTCLQSGKSPGLNALILLICKSEKDRTLPSSYRPISLLNVNLKLITHI